MSTSVFFIGAGFYVASAVSRSPGVVRVTFNNVPQASNPASIHDALNPANYTFSGPGPATAVSVAPVSGIPEAFDVTLSGPLNIGTWTVTVAATLEDVDSSAITIPTAAVFLVSVLFAISPLNGGAMNDSSQDIIRKHLNPALQGPTWDAVIAALADGDNTNWANAESAFDQLFLSTASGSWLAKRAGDEGITKPENVGISDSLFRDYAIKLSTKKVVHQAIREILEVFYGQDAERAFIEAQLDEPYNLAGSPDLTWSLDEKQNFLVDFEASWFSVPSSATAVEVAVALTKFIQDQGSNGFAIPFRSPVTGGNRVRIYSGSLGLGSFARATGGLAQNIFQFPSLLRTYTGSITVGTGYSWVYSNPNPTTTRATLVINTGLGSPLVTLLPVIEGDYVIITASAGIGIVGTFPVSNVMISWSGANLTQSFDLPTIAFSGSALQQNNLAYSFYHPVKSSILAAGGRTVLVAQPVNGEIDISIPATTQAVNRGPKLAFYGRLNPDVVVETMQRTGAGTVTVTTLGAHGLQTGQQVLIDGFQPKPTYPLTGAGQTSVSPYQAPASWVDLVTTSAVAPVHGTSLGAACAIASGMVLFAGGIQDGSTTSVAISNRFQATTSAIFTSADEANGSTQWSYQWVATASLNTARQRNAISPFGSGAMTTGGISSSSTYLASMETYTPDAWVTGSPMNTARAEHSQLTLLNGDVLVMSGIGTGPAMLSSTELYNGSSWTTVGSLVISRARGQAVQLSNGTVLVIGGYTNTGHTHATNTVEVSTNNGTSWSLGPNMTYTRGDFQATLLPGDYVLVTGGLGYDPTNSASGGLVTLNQAEIYDPIANRWYTVRPTGVARNGHLAVYSSLLNQVLVAGGNSTGSDDTTVVEGFDVTSRKWRTWPSKLAAVRNYVMGAVTTSGLIPVMGGGSPVFDSVAILIPASDAVSAGDMNGQFVVTATPLSNQFQFQTVDRKIGLNYTSSFGTSNIGVPLAHQVTAQHQPVNDPGPYIYDPDNGVSVTDIASTTAGFELFSGQQYASIVVAGQGEFPNEQGWIVLGFGTDQQTPPIQLLGTFADTGGNTRLLIDYSYRFTSDFLIGAEVTLLSQREPFVPAHPEQVGSCYITASSAGRVAAEAAAEAALAAGVNPNIVIVYPGDRGLGGEGNPTHGAQKLSDIVEVFAGDDISADVQTAREN